MPALHELANWRQRIPRVRQCGDFWCIPASMENMLSYCDIRQVTQHDLVLAFCRHLGGDVLLDPLTGQTRAIDISRLDDANLLRAARDSALGQADFGTFSRTAEKVPLVSGSPWKFEKVERAIESERLVLASEALDRGWPTAISAIPKAGGYSHILVLVSVTPGELVVFDPASGRDEPYDRNQWMLSNDILILRPRS